MSEEEEKLIENSKEKKDKIGTNYINDYILTLLMNEPNRILEELCFSIVNYKVEVEKLANENKENSSFKQNLYKELESLLCQASYIERREDRNEKIEKIYNWYKDRMKNYMSLAKITEKTYYDSDEKPKILKEKKISEDISAISHRTNFAKGFNIKLYRVKKIRIKSKKKNFTKQKINSSKLEYYKNEEGKTTKKKEKEQKLIEKQKLPSMSTVSTWISSISSKRELQSSYSYAEPKFTFSQAVIESKIIKEKQKALAKKRTEEEIKEAINEFGEKRALFKGNREKKYVIKEILNLYSTKNTKVPELTKQFNRSLSQSLTAKEKDEFFKKVILSKVKNINNETLQVNKSSNEIKVNINMKLKKYISRHKILRNLQTEEHPNDTMIAHISSDSLLKVKASFKKMCHLSNKRINDRAGHLSAYDNKNINLLNRKIKYEEEDSSQNNSTTFGSREYAKKLFRHSSMDLLSVRQTMQCFQMNEVMSLKKSIKNEKLNRSCLIEASVSPSINMFYPKFYLPLTGSGLLPKPIEFDIKVLKNKNISI